MWNNWDFKGSIWNSTRKYLTQTLKPTTWIEILTICTSFLPDISFDLRVLSLSVYVCPSIRPCINHLLVSTITPYPFKLGSPNFDQKCKTPWLRSLWFWGAIDFQGRSQIVPNSELEDCLCDNSLSIQAGILKFVPEVQNNMVMIPIVFGDPGWSLERFMVSTLSPSLPSAHILI